MPGMTYLKFMTANPSRIDPRGVQAGAPGGWPAKPLGAELSLEFYRRQGLRLVVQADSSVSVAAVNGMIDYDSSIYNFHKRAGLGDSSGVSFESSTWPGRYLRRSFHGVRVSGGGWFDFGFNDDATFYPDGNQRYESKSLPGSYLRVSGSQIIMSRLDGVNDPDSLYETIIFERDPWTLSLLVWGPASWTVQGDDAVFAADGSCTGLTPWFGLPNTTQVTFVFYYGSPPPWGAPRVVQVSVSSTYLYGLYPIIRCYARWPGDNFIYKIVPASQVCAW
jgi:hypothetical protein